MKTIQLYGELGKIFGKEFHLDVKTSAEAIRALCTQLKGFRKHIEVHSEPGYVIKVAEEEKTVEGLHDPVSKQEVIKIIPIIAGAGGDGWTSIIIGVVLIAVTWYFLPAGGALANALTGMGASMIVGGISALLAPSPASNIVEQQKNPEARPSYLFNGVVNTIGPGNAVGLGYGTMLIGSQIVSAEITTVEETA